MVGCAQACSLHVGKKQMEKQELVGQHPLQVPAPKDLVSFFLGLKTHHPALSHDLRRHPSILPPPLKRHQDTF